MKKLLIWVPIIFILTGCSVDYNMYIKSDGTIEEKIVIDKNNISNEKKYNDLKESFENEYESTLSKYNYTYNVSYDNSVATFKIEKTGNINYYFNNSLFKEFYEDYELFNSGNEIVFKNIGSNYLSSIFVSKNYEPANLDRGDLNEVRINITFDNKVIYSNADSYDENTNTYTWILQKENPDKNIQFSYDTNNVVILSNNQEEQKKSESTQQTNIINITKIKIIILVVSIVSIIILFVVIVAITIRKKENKI